MEGLAGLGHIFNCTPVSPNYRFHCSESVHSVHNLRKIPYRYVAFFSNCYHSCGRPKSPSGGPGNPSLLPRTPCSKPTISFPAPLRPPHPHLDHNCCPPSITILPC